MAVKGSHVEEKILLLCKQFPDVSLYSVNLGIMVSMTCLV